MGVLSAPFFTPYHLLKQTKSISFPNHQNEGKTASLHSCPSNGHLVSAIEFAKRILDRNGSFLITMLVIRSPFGTDINNYIKELEATHTCIRFITLPEVTPPAPELIAKRPEHYLALYVEDHGSHVKDAISNQVMAENPAPISAVVLDMFCTPFIGIAKEIGVSSYIFFTCNAAFLGFMLFLAERNNEPGFNRFIETDSDYIFTSYANPVPCSVLPSALLHNSGSFPNLGIKFKETNGIVVNTFTALEPYAVSSLLAKDDVPPIYTVGPIIDFKGKGLEGSKAVQRDEIMKWLDNQPEKSVVFLCFGSGGSFEEVQVKEIAEGLEQSGHRFLWSLRKRPSNHQVMPGEFENYEEILPEGFMERTKNVGMVCGWAPQVEVLAHKSIAAFLSHCGWNSISESLWNGVPIITWPLYGEQQINAFQFVKDLGLAFELKMDYRSGQSETVKAEEVAKAVKSVMENAGEVKNKVREVSEMARLALSEAGSSYAAFGRLIDRCIGNKP